MSDGNKKPDSNWYGELDGDCYGNTNNNTKHERQLLNSKTVNTRVLNCIARKKSIRHQKQQWQAACVF